MKVALEVFSPVDFEGSDALNEMRGEEGKEEAWGLMSTLVLAMLSLISQGEIHLEVRKLSVQFQREISDTAEESQKLENQKFFGPWGYY